MFKAGMQIEGYDDELWAAITAEEQRQEDHIELIASENFRFSGNLFMWIIKKL